MVFCNEIQASDINTFKHSHNPYFNRWFSAINYWDNKDCSEWEVTILILIDGFLQ